jgi:hypothetical protein
VTIRDEALARSTPGRCSAADRDCVTPAVDEQTDRSVGVGIALAEHGHRQPHVGQLPAGLQPVDRNVHRARDVPKLELGAIANVDHDVVRERRGKIIGLDRSTSLERVHTRIVPVRPGATGSGFRPRRTGTRRAAFKLQIGAGWFDSRCSALRSDRSDAPGT